MSLFIDGVAFVTGAGNGIGRACAITYAAEGARAVIFADLDHDSAVAAAQESQKMATHPSYQSLALCIDVISTDSVDAAYAAAVAAFGRIDYSVHSAGVGVQKSAPIDSTDHAEFNRFWQVNVMGTLYCVQAAVRQMKQQQPRTVSIRGCDRSVGRGAILNLGSCNSFVATPAIVQYTTTKHAVLGLTRNAALDCAEHEIRINCICPGWVDTQMVRAAISGNPDLPGMMSSIIPMSRIAMPAEIADVVVFMTSPRASYVTGASWIVDGGTTLQVQTC